VTQHKTALRSPAATTAEHRTVGARKSAAASANARGAPGAVAKRYASSMVAECRPARAIAKCCAANAVAKRLAASAVATDRAVSAVAKLSAVSAGTKCRAVSTVTNLSPARTASPDLPGERAGARRGCGATEAHPVRYAVRNGEAPATPRRRRRRSASTSDSTGVGPPVSKEMRINVGATRVGNLFARLQLHLATARFLAELRGDALWETACDDAALELDTLVSGMAPEALAAPLHPRVPPAERGDGDRMSRTAAHAPTRALEGRLRRRNGTRRVSTLEAPDLPAIAAGHFPAAVTATGRGALATSDSGSFTGRGPAPARSASFCGTPAARGSTSALIASRATARIAPDSGAFTVSDATFNVRQATPALGVPSVTISITHPPGPPPHRTARQPFSQEKGAR
jgi:hypothetical protein